jgi:hypothetical protein
MIYTHTRADYDERIICDSYCEVVFVESTQITYWHDFFPWAMNLEQGVLYLPPPISRGVDKCLGYNQMKNTSKNGHFLNPSGQRSV